MNYFDLLGLRCFLPVHSAADGKLILHSVFSSGQQLVEMRNLPFPCVLLINFLKLARLRNRRKRQLGVLNEVVLSALFLNMAYFLRPSWTR